MKVKDITVACAKKDERRVDLVFLKRLSRLLLVLYGRVVSFRRKLATNEVSNKRRLIANDKKLVVVKQKVLIVF